MFSQIKKIKYENMVLEYERVSIRLLYKTIHVCQHHQYVSTLYQSLLIQKFRIIIILEGANF